MTSQLSRLDFRGNSAPRLASKSYHHQDKLEAGPMMRDCRTLALPVKSMAGEPLQIADVREIGIVGTGWYTSSTPFGRT